MGRLILIRHGDTKWSEEGRYMGTTDVSLNQRGIIQAKAISQVLCKEKLDIIYSSTLSRANATARIIAKKHKVTHLKDSRLNELCFGDWEGLTFTEIATKYTDQWKQWQADLESFSPPKGENVREFKDRVLSFLSFIQVDLGEQTVAIVSHGGSIKIMLLHALDTTLKSFWRLKVNLGSISRIEYYEGGPLVTLINQTTHLNQKIKDD